jgi:hypothetical protein
MPDCAHAQLANGLRHADAWIKTKCEHANIVRSTADGASGKTPVRQLHTSDVPCPARCSGPGPPPLSAHGLALWLCRRRPPLPLLPPLMVRQGRLQSEYQCAHSGCPRAGSACTHAMPGGGVFREAMYNTYKHSHSTWGCWPLCCRCPLGCLGKGGFRRHSLQHRCCCLCRSSPCRRRVHCCSRSRSRPRPKRLPCRHQTCTATSLCSTVCHLQTVCSNTCAALHAS